MEPSNPAARAEHTEWELKQSEARYRDLWAASDRYIQALKAAEAAPPGSQERLDLGAVALGAFMILVSETYR